MSLRRALAPALVVFVLLVGVGALCAIVSRMAAAGDTTSGTTESERSVTQEGSRLIISASSQGSLIWGWDPSEDGVSSVSYASAYGADGSHTWEMSNVAEAIDAGWPAAVVVSPEPAATEGGTATYRVLRVGPDGPQEIAHSQGEVRLLRADSKETVYVETVWNELGIPRTTVVTIDEGGRHDTAVPGNGSVQGGAISRDGDLLAVVTRCEDANYLTWFKRDSEGAWKLISQEPTDDYYVVLSDDGQQAILGPETPVLLTGNRQKQVSLPVDYVAEARFGSSRILLIDFRVIANRMRTVAYVVDVGSHLVEWSREFDGEQRIASDEEVFQLAYAQPSKREIVVVDLSTRTERVFQTAPVHDVAFMAPDRLVMALQDGAVTTLTIGGRQ